MTRIERHRAPGAGDNSNGLRGWLAWSVPAVAALCFLLFTFLPSLTTLRHGFPTYYVSARLIWVGRWSPLVYDNDWFVAEVQARTPNQVGEVFAPNPPSAALLMLPLAWLDISLARQVWL